MLKKFWRDKLKVLFLLIIILSIFLRFYKIGSYPALNADEAALGYNAYSLLKTGMDEHGNRFPIHFQSFNDYKPGLYVYLIMPFVKILGLNIWSVRLPNLVLSVLSVFILYELILKLFKNEKQALTGALFLAISPWHLHFSRGGWEVNTATFFVLAGIFLFIKGLEKVKYFYFSIILFTASLYTYHATRIIVPLLGLSLVIIYFKEVWSKRSSFLIACLLGLIIILPLGLDILKPEAISRAAGVGLFADPGPLNRINEQRGEHGNYSGIVAKFFHNKFVNYGLAFVGNWTEHYHGEFLFLSGDEIERNKVPETGQMYIADLLFILVAFYALASNFKKMDGDTKKSWYLILVWLFVAPVAAALTFQSPHALRAENMVIPLIVISSFGATVIFEILTKIKGKTSRKAGLTVLIVLIVWQFGRYLHIYYYHMAREYQYSSQYGVKELVDYLKSINTNKYEKIVITDRYDQPYILMLFYLKYPPEKFQGDHQLTPRDKFGFSTVPGFDKFIFKGIDFDGDKVAYPNSLIIGTNEEIAKETNVIKNIYGSNDFLYFQVIEN